MNGNHIPYIFTSTVKYLFSKGITPLIDRCIKSVGKRFFHDGMLIEPRYRIEFG